MKKLLALLALLFAGAPTAWPAAPALQAGPQGIRPLTNAENFRNLPVAFSAKNAFYESLAGHLFAQSGRVAIHSTIGGTGVDKLHGPDPYNGRAAANLLLRPFGTATVMAAPSWWSDHKLDWIIGLLLAILLVVLGWGWTLERKLRQQTDLMAARAEVEAALERLRSRLLEDINGSEPLESVLKQIAEMVSFRMGGAPCWCEITDGARLGLYKPMNPGLAVVKEEIRARSGSLLGVLYAVPALETDSTADFSEVLSIGAQLAALAIETRSHYSDLVRRSEFDPLTAINNRFSLERLMDERLEEARKNSGIFGLIYIDLDDFKQVNDLYGHHIGDLYLQGVTMRMKNQLRPNDVMARLGGDEFGVLVRVVRNRAEMEEIAVRLERCLSDPISIEGRVLRGTASFGIALYPEDADTRDSLLNAADAAMYATKRNKRQTGSVAENQ